MASTSTITLPADSNQALGIAQYTIDFVRNKNNSYDIDPAVYDKVKLFHTDSVICGISALALQTNAPTILRQEALNYTQKSGGAKVFGSSVLCPTEKAVAANCSAVREWDSNGTVFGYNKRIPGHQAGEFGHNDYYPVVVAAAHANPSINGKLALRAMICIDEIRGRLAEVFSLKTYKIDHVVHGAIASAAVYGALMGATAEQIESAIGMVVAHYIPWRAIRAGKQLSDSKGASAALSTEVAVLSMKRAMNGFQGPKDIFRNPESLFCWFSNKNDGKSPFNLVLTTSGSSFAVCDMHFKMGLYEHQSAAAIEGVIKLLTDHPEIYKESENIQAITIKSYEPAFGIIGDPAKRNPQTRQSADHSMVYIVATVLRKAIESKAVDTDEGNAWCQLMLTPYDYSKEALANYKTRQLMEKIIFEHGGPEYDSRYPEGIPTTVDIQLLGGKSYSSGLMMFPPGHAQNSGELMKQILDKKFELLGSIGLPTEECKKVIRKLQNVEEATVDDMQNIYNFECDLSVRDPVD